MTHLLDDPYLKPYEAAIRGRAAHAFARANELTQGKTSLVDWANAHNYFGLHRDRRGWVFREWAPHATSMWLVGDFNGWKIDPDFEIFRLPGTDVWERRIATKKIKHLDKYHLEMRWDGGRGERIPAYARYVVQDEQTKLFAACVWDPKKKFVWKNGGRWNARPTVCTAPRTSRPNPSVGSAFRRRPQADSAASTFPPSHSSTFPLIYEAHVGMAGEEPRVHSYAEFRDEMLPRIKAAGYDTVQLMAIMEHPYYGSFGYHVSSFFAASSRFGTPDDLKSLVDTAHGMGLRVIMDLVHSHAVANERDGLSRFDGTDYQYFHSGAKGWHSAWGSRCFDYGKTEVIHFLLSNCKFWLQEYDFDGYRFDGVTSMLFWDHGLGAAFTDYSMYFNGSMDDDAWCYLQLANRVIHETKPGAITIAEDVSGMPGVAAPATDCGIGFDYRMAMGEPDYWFRLAEKVRDDDWSMGGLFYELTNKRAEEKVVSYVESHDQALVGGKTFFFTMADAAVYTGMGKDQHGLEIDRAVALHKMARLATAALAGGAYLNFMGNEFGHPEWIDFPRAENGWDYSHCRRQWSLRDDPNLRFKALGDFDAAMLAVLKGGRSLFGGGRGATALPSAVGGTTALPSAVGGTTALPSAVGGATALPSAVGGTTALPAAVGGTTALPGNGALAAKPAKLVANEADKVLAFMRGDLIFVFNFSPTRSFEGYGILVPPASDWRHVLDTDEPRFGGQGRIWPDAVYTPALVHDEVRGEIVLQIKLYLPARTAIVLKRCT